MYNAFWRHALFVRVQSFSVKTFDRSRNGCHVIALRANDVKVSNLQFLSEFCHFSHFNDKSQTKVKNSLMVISVCLSEFRVYK